jgi:hypothetical protein
MANIGFEYINKYTATPNIITKLIGFSITPDKKLGVSMGNII